MVQNSMPRVVQNCAPITTVRYERFLALAAPVLFDRLDGLAGPVCLMCAEKLVCECHRRHIAAHLEKAKGWTFTHIE